MVRLMRWMIGFILTSLSSSIRSQISNVNNGKNKYFSKESGDGGGGKQQPLMYEEPTSEFQKQLHYPIEYEERFKDSLQLRHLMELPSNGTCIPPAIDDFPPDFFTPQQRSKGAIILHFLLGIYACYGLAVICDTYFVPSLELISLKLGISSDVAGATFMAAGTSSPEFFESIIGSFITEGDIGVGTIVGSAVFNILAVTSVCGLLAGKIVPLDWWPLTRDCAFYTISVVALIIVIYDEKVYWYEATALLVMFVFYVLMMRFNRRLSAFFHSFSCCRSKENRRVVSAIESNITKAEIEVIKQTAVDIAADVNEAAKANGDAVCNDGVDGVCNGLLDETQTKVEDHGETFENGDFSPVRFPEGCLRKIIYLVTYPINILFFVTVPNCGRPGWERLYPLTFFMSVVYIGSLSYFVAWMVTVIGYTIGIPDTVMGITFLAIGTSVPEGYSSVIVCKKGMGNMAISNSVGSNVFDILFCLGLPWLIKASAFSGGLGYVQINSSGLVYSAMSLLATVVLLYLVIAIFDFRLNVKVGITCFVLYSAFLIFASLVETNVFGLVNPPTCLT